MQEITWSVRNEMHGGLKIQICEGLNLPIIATTSANMWPSDIKSRPACIGRNNSLLKLLPTHVKLLVLQPKLEGLALTK